MMVVRGANWKNMGRLRIFDTELVQDGVRLMRAKYDNDEESVILYIKNYNHEQVQLQGIYGEPIMLSSKQQLKLNRNETDKAFGDLTPEFITLYGNEITQSSDPTILSPGQFQKISILGSQVPLPLHTSHQAAVENDKPSQAPRFLDESA